MLRSLQDPTHSRFGGLPFLLKKAVTQRGSYPATGELRQSSTNPLVNAWKSERNPINNAYVNLRYNPGGKRDQFLNSVGIMTMPFGGGTAVASKGLGLASRATISR